MNDLEKKDLFTRDFGNIETKGRSKFPSALTVVLTTVQKMIEWRRAYKLSTNRFLKRWDCLRYQMKRKNACLYFQNAHRERKKERKKEWTESKKTKWKKIMEKEERILDKKERNRYRGKKEE